MAQIPENTLHKWSNGEIVTSENMNLNQDIVRAAINDTDNKLNTNYYDKTGVDQRIQSVSGTPVIPVVNSFPSVGSMGQIIYHSGQRRLYTHDGTGWKADADSVKGVDGSKMVNTDQKNIANGYAGLDAGGKISSGVVPALNYVPTANVGVANGVASLDASGSVPGTQLGNIQYKIPEFKIPMCMNSRSPYSVVGGSTQPPPGYYVAKGDGLNTTTAGSTASRLYTHVFESTVDVAFEAWLASSNLNATAYQVVAELWDMTTNTAVPNTQLQVGGLIYTRMRTSKLKLVQGHDYGIRYWQIATTGGAYIMDASIVVFL